jgi:arylsulfatase A-like enzyme
MGKQNMYDHSVRVPLIMSGPGIPAGERRDAFCYLLDIYPTLCDLVGVPIPDSVEGRSLAPALRKGDRIRDTLSFAYRHLQRSVRDDRYKLIEYVVQGEQTTQLFDLESDPWERSNLANDPGQASRLSGLRRELQRWRDELDDDKEAFWQHYEP